MDPMMVLFGVLFVGIIGAYVAVKARKPATADGMSVEAMQAVVARKERPDSLLERILAGRRTGGASLLERNLITAGMMVKPYEFLAGNMIFLVIMLMLDALMIGHMQIGSGLFGLAQIAFAAIIVPWFGWKFPQMVLQYLANKRRNTLEIQLAEALTLIASGLKGGYSFIQGLSQAAEQLQDPITGEISRVVRLIQLGLDTPRALEQMSQRVNSYDYDMTVSATNIQLASGGNLAQLLEKIAETIRDRIRLRRDIAVLTAQGRMSGGILIALPLGIAFMLNIINREYFLPMYTSDLGKSLLIGAGIQQGVGIYWIKKLLDFDN